MPKLNHYISYTFIRLCMWPIGFLPIWAIHAIGKGLGIVLFYLHKKFRKRALSNLALANSLNLSNEQIKTIAKGSFQNLCITALEYAKLERIKTPKEIVTCQNPKEAKEIIKSGKGVIFFCAHQANWELLFLDGTYHMPGVAIGKPIKNKLLYHWVKNIREKFSGTIIEPKNAFKEGLKALKKGKFLGIVGDQGMPESFYSSSFLGRKAYTSPLPALLSYRTGAPIIFASIKRASSYYYIHYSDPIYPDTHASHDLEIPRLMDQVLSLLEQSIQQTPEQWLWQHNRWKQETPTNVFYRYRYDSLLVIIPKSREYDYRKVMQCLRTIYPKAFIDVLCPSLYKNDLADLDVSIIPYAHDYELIIDSYKHKLVFNFTTKPLSKHYLKRAAFLVLTWNEIQSLSNEDQDPCKMLYKALTRPGVFI